MKINVFAFYTSWSGYKRKGEPTVDDRWTDGLSGGYHQFIRRKCFAIQPKIKKFEQDTYILLTLAMIDALNKL